MQGEWGFFEKNRPLYAGIGIFREGEPAGKQPYAASAAQGNDGNTRRNRTQNISEDEDPG